MKLVKDSTLAVDYCRTTVQYSVGLLDQLAYIERTLFRVLEVIMRFGLFTVNTALRHRAAVWSLT